MLLQIYNSALAPAAKQPCQVGLDSPAGPDSGAGSPSSSYQAAPAAKKHRTAAISACSGGPAADVCKDMEKTWQEVCWHGLRVPGTAEAAGLPRVPSSPRDVPGWPAKDVLASLRIIAPAEVST